MPTFLSVPLESPDIKRELLTIRRGDNPSKQTRYEDKWLGVSVVHLGGDLLECRHIRLVAMGGKGEKSVEIILSLELAKLLGGDLITAAHDPMASPSWTEVIPE